MTWWRWTHLLLTWLETRRWKIVTGLEAVTITMGAARTEELSCYNEDVEESVSSGLSVMNAGSIWERWLSLTEWLWATSYHLDLPKSSLTGLTPVLFLISLVWDRVFLHWKWLNTGDVQQVEMTPFVLGFDMRKLPRKLCKPKPCKRVMLVAGPSGPGLVQWLLRGVWMESEKSTLKALCWPTVSLTVCCLLDWLSGENTISCFSDVSCFELGDHPLLRSL